jgi:hypothetical protein
MHTSGSLSAGDRNGISGEDAPAAVALAREDRRTAVATIDHVVGQVISDRTKRPGHDERLAGVEGPVNEE